MSTVFVLTDKRKNAGIDTSGSKYFLDCTVSVSHDFNNSVTEHPVETGASFTDHVQRMNNTHNVVGQFSGIPLIKYTGDTLPLQNRLAEAYKFLMDLRDNAIRFTIVSKYDVYNDCVIENLNIPVDSDGEFSLKFSMTLKQIRLANTELTNIVQTDLVRPDKVDDASQRSDTGKTNTNKQSDRESIAKQITNALSEAVALDDRVSEETKKQVIQGTSNGTN